MVTVGDLLEEEGSGVVENDADEREGEFEAETKLGDASDMQESPRTSGRVN